MDENFNQTHDKSMEEFDSGLAPLLMNFDNDVKYIKILSQEDFNEIEPDNDTIYFINNIYETVSSITNILDVAVSHTKRDSNEPEHIWALTVDEEMEEVSLWRAQFTGSGHFSLIKIFHDFVDGRLTFDGIYEYDDNYSKATLITNSEPFLALIKSNGQLRAFPNLNIKDRSDDEPGMLVAGNENSPVKTCSVEKGYCSELFKEYDQGVVIAYSILSSGGYDLRYRQFRYVNPSDTTKLLAGETTICRKSEEIFNIAVRRLNDYRLGITYNYWVINENDERVSYTEFRYSNRQYAGIAYHPEVIEIKGLPKIGQILYGAVRNDNIVGPESPYLSRTEEDFKIIDIVNKADPTKKSKATEINFGLMVDNTSNSDDSNESIPIDIELINVSEKSSEFNDVSEIDYASMLGFEIRSDWLETYRFRNDVLENDPDYEEYNSAYAPEVIDIKTQGNKLIITLKGEGIPLTPFKIVPTSTVDNVINLRYNVGPFNTTVGKNLAGWFALTNFQPSELGNVKTRDCSTETGMFRDYAKRLLERQKMSVKFGDHGRANKDFSLSFHVNSGTGGGISHEPTVEQQELNAYISISYSFSGSGTTRRISSINV